MGNLVSMRYATSLFELAVEENILDCVFEDMKTIASVVAEQPEFMLVLSVPTITKEEKDKLLDDAFGGSFNERTVSFLHILVQKSRIMYLDGIIEDFAKLYRKEKNIKLADATTAVPLTPQLAKKLTEKLELITGKTIELKNIVDPKVVGGLLLNLEGEEMDGSVQGQIDGIRKAISSVTL